ncbi:Dabb family protein [Massilia sp. TN1-12]|uniref:Dabb family protein n=1 Tax=Massilia paldalensis TaxID=3377675 RepID=UPI003850D135
MTAATATAALRHIVMFSFKEGTTPERIDALVAGLGGLRHAIPQIAGYEWGTNVSPENMNDGFTHCFTLTFTSAEDRDAYLVHPAHQAFVGTLGDCVQRALVVDYWVQ